MVRGLSQMSSKKNRLSFPVAATLALFAVRVNAEDAVDYLRDVKPLFASKCVRCHGAGEQQATLRLDSGRGATTGGDSGAAITPGKAAESLLIHAVTGTNGASKMPPEGEPLNAEQIQRLIRWIDAGAKFPDDEVTPPATKRQSDHWAFQPIRAVPPPRTQRTDWARNGIDPFVLHGLEAVELPSPAVLGGRGVGGEGALNSSTKEEKTPSPRPSPTEYGGRGRQRGALAPSPEAPRTTLLRRVHLDLLGLPPSPELVDEFLADTAPDAYERLVDRLLANPHFGERWGRDWLDAARYADSNGFTRDMPRTIWKYRDWVVDALNRNLPFNQFVIEQLAGDLLPNATTEQRVATGFHRNTLINEEGGTDPEQFRVEAVVDRVGTTGTVFLGLTVACCQCHDHKYDPLAQREFYQLFAFFNSAAFTPGDPAAPRIDVPSPDQLRQGEPARKQAVRQQIAEMEQALQAKEGDIQAAQDTWEKSLTEDDKKKLPFNVKNAVDLPVRDRSVTHKTDLAAYFRALDVARQQFPELEQIAQLRKSEPQFVTTMVVEELPQPRETFVMVRGDFLRPGAKVQPDVPAVLPPLPATDRPRTRLDLAAWLISPDQPLTPRVTVNRIWQRYFGRGLVETENDFGTQGERPTHPELLDWLSAEFVRTGWDVKALHRLIVTSATYRQSSTVRADLVERDPLNKLLGRQARLRLEAEHIRDAALAAGGLLTEELGGAPVTPPQPDGVFDFTQDKKPWTAATGRDRHRRGMYTYLWRSSLYPSLTVFDFPDPNVACTRRNRSNTPLQSLTLANDQTFVEFARGFATRLLNESGDDVSRLRTAVKIALGREPQSLEAARLGQFLQQQRDAFAKDTDAAKNLVGESGESTTALTETAAWTAVARVLLNLDEFITRE
jgi:mono/diheme cytochrome c family protein